VGRLLLIQRPLRVAAGLLLAITEQELDEAAAHVGTLRMGGADRRLRQLIGEDHPRLLGDGLEGGGGIDGGGEERRAGEQRKGGFAGHWRTLYCFALAVPAWRRCTRPIEIKTASVW